ncbi:lipase family protein [Massilia sp. R2A-15]|uniref:lipase family protein n=1 Tax=Massilia sp. R2A-15 TaxID=3064278 RepID=UPI00273718D3|nr:lipase family protein [Massilia sp. R2A-15]WLI89463.1 lipase family protein [Massilia sp. R2A-15]
MNTTIALGAEQAARIADGVYLLRQANRWDVIKSRGQKGINDSLKISGQFSMESSNRFGGSSGGNLSRSESGFGYIAEGVEDRKHELLIGIRGTITGADWVTDFQQTLHRGPSGFAVHRGFLRTFDSFEPALRDYLRKAHKNPTIVHIVGHSLGGALATITADYLRVRGLAVKLYTFGSPRVGVDSFSEQLSNQVGAENMFRVSNQSDPVTMLPIFPFIHVPNNSAQYMIPSWGGVNFCNHFLERYIESCSRKDWKNLEARVNGSWSEQAMAWLESASASGGAVQIYSAKALWMIMKCLNHILRSAAGDTYVAAGETIMGFATVVDHLTMILHRGILESQKIKNSATKLISVIMKFLGRNFVAGTNLTVSFIRWVLDLLFRALSTMAYQALRLANM